jgi:hypothetical protein
LKIRSAIVGRNRSLGIVGHGAAIDGGHRKVLHDLKLTHNPNQSDHRRERQGRPFPV